MQGVTRAIADHSRTVRVPVHVHDTLGRIRKAKSRLLSEGSSASVQVMSYTEMGGCTYHRDWTLEMLEATRRIVS